MVNFQPSSADSAGQPWAGRHFEQNRFPNDDGTAPPSLIAAISRFRSREANLVEVLKEFSKSRVLVPLVTVLGDTGFTEQGKKVDKSQELSVVNVGSPDGRRALPVFSSVAAMNAWNPKARPVAIEGERVAFSAAEEGTELIVLDPTAPTEIVIRRPAIWAIAQGQEWLPSFESVEVAKAFSASVSNEAEFVNEVRLSNGDPQASLAGPELRVELELVSGLDRAQVESLLSRLTLHWSESDVIRQQVDSMAVSVVAAN